MSAAVRIACCALLFAACGGGGGSGGGGVAPAPAGPAPAVSQATLAWDDAEGPVSGYSVYVQRDGGGFKHEKDVSAPTVTLTGAPGQTARIRVFAFDAGRKVGPPSRPSALFTFPEPGASALSASSSSASTAASATSRSVATASASAGSAASAAPASDPAESPAEVALTGALVWQAGDVLRITNASLDAELVFPLPAAGSRLAAIADFDGDGQGDLLWVGVAGAVAYTPAASLRPGASETPVVGLGTLQADEQVLAAGDFDGDGYGDLLIARAGGAIDAWFTAPGIPVEIFALGSAAQAVVAGVGDFDGNGIEDIAWRAPEGALAVWLMGGGQAAASIDVALASELGVSAVGDFDGDGAAEIAVRDPNGAMFVVHPLAVPLVVGATDVANTQGWQAAGAADLDRDGSDDIVLAGSAAVRIAWLPGEDVLPLDPASPWQLVALLP